MAASQLDRKIELGEAIGLIAYYVAYVFLVVIGRQVYQWRSKKNSGDLTQSSGAWPRWPVGHLGGGGGEGGASHACPIFGTLRPHTSPPPPRTLWLRATAALLIQDAPDYTASPIAVEAGLKFRGARAMRLCVSCAARTLD